MSLRSISEAKDATMGSTRVAILSMAPGSTSTTCLVEGCMRIMREESPYYRRYTICKVHLKAPQLLLNGLIQRFCQQCAKFHPLTEFDGGKRSCRDTLHRHGLRRRMKLITRGPSGDQTPARRVRRSAAQCNDETESEVDTPEVLDQAPDAEDGEDESSGGLVKLERQSDDRPNGPTGDCGDCLEPSHVDGTHDGEGGRDRQADIIPSEHNKRSLIVTEDERRQDVLPCLQHTFSSLQQTSVEGPSPSCPIPYGTSDDLTAVQPTPTAAVPAIHRILTASETSSVGAQHMPVSDFIPSSTWPPTPQKQVPRRLPGLFRGLSLPALQSTTLPAAHGRVAGLSPFSTAAAAIVPSSIMSDPDLERTVLGILWQLEQEVQTGPPTRLQLKQEPGERGGPSEPISPFPDNGNGPSPGMETSSDFGRLELTAGGMSAAVLQQRIKSEPGGSDGFAHCVRPAGAPVMNGSGCWRSGGAMSAAGYEAQISPPLTTGCSMGACSSNWGATGALGALSGDMGVQAVASSDGERKIFGNPGMAVMDSGMNLVTATWPSTRLWEAPITATGPWLSPCKQPPIAPMRPWISSGGAGDWPAVGPTLPSWPATFAPQQDPAAILPPYRPPLASQQSQKPLGPRVAKGWQSLPPSEASSDQPNLMSKTPLQPELCDFQTLVGAAGLLRSQDLNAAGFLEDTTMPVASRQHSLLLMAGPPALHVKGQQQGQNPPLPLQLWRNGLQPYGDGLPCVDGMDVAWQNGKKQC